MGTCLRKAIARRGRSLNRDLLSFVPALGLSEAHLRLQVLLFKSDVGVGLTVLPHPSGVLQVARDHTVEDPVVLCILKAGVVFLSLAVDR